MNYEVSSITNLWKRPKSSKSLSQYISRLRLRTSALHLITDVSLCHDVWVYYNDSPIGMVRPLGMISPMKTMISSKGGRSEVITIDPDILHNIPLYISYSMCTYIYIYVYSISISYIIYHI